MNKVSDAEYARRLRKVAAFYAKAGYYRYSQHYRNRADSVELSIRSKQSLKEKSSVR